MSEPYAERPRRSRRRRILIVAIVAILLALVARTVLDLWAGHLVSVETSRLEQTYGSLEGRNRNWEMVPLSENRARALRAAGALMVDRNEMADSTYRYLNSGAPLPVPADLRAFVERNTPAIGVAAAARDRPRSNWDADYPTGSNLPDWMEMRSLSNAIYLSSLIELEAGRPDGAAAAIASGLALSASVRQEPDVIAQLLRLHFAFQHFEAVQRLVTQSEPSRTSLDEFAKLLDENRLPDPFQLGLLSELKGFDSILARMENGSGVPHGMMADLLPMEVARVTGAAESPFWLSPLARFSRPLIRLARARYLEQMGKLIAWHMGPRPRPDFPETRSRWGLLNRLAYTPVLGIRQTIDTGDLFRTERALTELAVALRRFRLDRGHYPDVLSELAPTYVPAVDLDVYTGKPPAYVRQGSGFRLSAQTPTSRRGLTASALDWNVPK